MFEGGTCIAVDWYFTHRSSDGSNSPPSGVYRKRISTNEEILRQLLAIKSDSNRESDGIVANMVWFSEHTYKLCVRYLTAPDLQKVLMDDGAFPYPESTWILQSFITPDYETSMNTIVSTPLEVPTPAGGSYFSPSVLVNKHKFQSGNITSMSLDPDQILVVDRFSSKLLKQAIEYQSQLADVCIRSLHPAIQLQFSYYFRFIESTGQLHLLWCQAVPSSSSSSVSAPQSLSSLSQTPQQVNWTNGKLMQEVLASYDSQANKQATSKSDGGKSSSGKHQQGPHQEKSGGKSRKEVIAALYLKKTKPHRKAKEGGKQLPPWNEINSVKYAIPDEDAERYDQIKKAYSVRNVALFDVPQPPQMPAPSHQFARPATSQSGRPRGPGTASAAAPRPSTSASTPGTSRSVMTDELSVGDLPGRPTPARTLSATPTQTPKLQPPPERSIPTEASLAPTASNALRHAEQFGRKGRLVRKARKEEADIGALIAPPGSSEDLIDYTTAIIMKVCDKLGQCLSEAQEFADEHRDAVVDLLQRRDSFAAASSAAGSGLRRNRPELSLHEDEELLSLSTQPAVETILRHIGLERDDDSVGESSGGDDDFSLTWSQKKFLKVLELLICVPNHRPADQLSTILLWILSTNSTTSPGVNPGAERPESDSRMHDDLIRLKNMMGGFSKYSYGVRSILAEVSQNQSLRSAGKDPSVQTTIDATINLRAWIVDKYQVIRSSGPSPLQRAVPGMGEGENEDYGDDGDYGENGMPVSRASTPGGDAPSPTTSVLLQRHAQGQAAESNPTAVDLINAPKKPLFSGPVQRLGRGYNSQQGVPGTAPVEVTRRVRAHVGMDAFLTATRLPRPSLLDAPTKNTSVRQSLRSSVAPPLVASYSEYPEERRHQDDGVVETGGENSGATGDDSGGLGFSQFNKSEVSRRDPRTSGILRELSFFQLAPKLSAGQRSLLLNSIIADAAQTIILNVSVLCRHTCAGREIAHDDLVALFGAHIITIIGSQLVNRLLTWLQSNRRSNSVFKRCNPALIELGMLVVLVRDEMI